MQSFKSILKESVLDLQWETVSCRSLSQAKDILTSQGIEFDSIYRTISMEKDYYTGAMTKKSYGIHYMINNGDERNVAYFSPDLDTLSYVLDGKFRIDGTPMEKRDIGWSKGDSPFSRNRTACSDWNPAQEPEKENTVCYNCGWERKDHLYAKRMGLM